jgi:hypothetical protein
MIRDTLKKAAGLFVEFDESSSNPAPADLNKPVEEWNVMTAEAPEPLKSAKTVEQIVREQPGPNLDEIKVPEASANPNPPTPPDQPVIRNDGSVHFDSIYRLASIPSVPFTAEQILELFNSLPADLPLESKRATIKVTLGAMAKSIGVTTEQVVADASRKLAALAAYNESFAKQAADFCTKAEVEIMTLEQQIADKKKAIEGAKSKQIGMNDACVKESDRLDDVLEFFSLDVPPSKLAK